MPVHDGCRCDQDERLPPPGPERSQRNPEQLVQGSQSSARSLRVQSQQLPTESQVFEDEVLAGAKSADEPPEEMPERHNHGKNIIGTIRIQLCAKSLILQMYDVLARRLPTIHSEPTFIWGKDQALPQSMRDTVNMQPWPDRRLLDLLKLEIPIIQAPMAGSDSVVLARSVSSTGALGSLACALLSPDEVREAVRALRNEMTLPFNLNFFCHKMEAPDTAATEKWKSFLRPHYEHLGLNIESIAESRLRLPFNDEMCAVVEEVRPEVVSFHFGLPTPNLVERLKR